MLRRKLQEMTESGDIALHPAMLVAITRDYPNSIQLLQSPSPVSRYTCFMHAFDFTEKPEYLDIACFGSKEVYAGPTFGQWLLEIEALIEMPTLENERESLVFYFNNENLKHVGLSQSGGKVISKWGTGHLYEHKIFEVPESYGLGIRVFKKLLYSDALSHFMNFAEANGIIFEPVE